MVFQWCLDSFVSVKFCFIHWSLWMIEINMNFLIRVFILVWLSFFYYFIFLFKGWIINSGCVHSGWAQSRKLQHRRPANYWIHNYKIINSNTHFRLFMQRFLKHSLVEASIESILAFSHLFSQNSEQVGETMISLILFIHK